MIPVIDLSLDSHVDEIEKALRGIGFFYVVNHGISQSELNSYFAVSKRFFQLAADDKKKLAKVHHFDTGFVGIGTENLEESRPGVIDLKEAYDLTVVDVHPIYNRNKWPSDEALPEWQSTVKSVSETLNEVGKKLVCAFSKAMGEDEAFLSQFYQNQPSSLLRFLHYPASAHRTDQGTFVGCGAHTDYGVLTILLQDSVGGLEIESNEGKYVPVPPVEGALVINVGDCVEYLTNGKFRATRHRVSSALPDERSVVVLFYEPSVEMPLKCLPKFTLDSSEKQVKTECVTFGEHLRKKLSSTYTI